MDIALTRAPIVPERTLPEDVRGQAGAVAEFLGLVRAEEGGQPIRALEYEAYLGMAEAELRRLCEELAQRHPCLFLRVRHRLGVVPAGEAAIHALAAARHRAEAFGMIEEFMDRLKQDVPIWKRAALPQAPEAPLA